MRRSTGHERKRSPELVSSSGSMDEATIRAETHGPPREAKRSTIVEYVTVIPKI